jgi:glycosyltransferase involved in cell wall biosynthesis
MKIGILIDRLNVGGVEKIAIEEVIALRKQKIDAELVVLRKKGVVDNAFPELLKKIPIVYLDKRLNKTLRFSFQFPIFQFFSLFHLTYPFFIPFVIKKNEYDYLIVHGTYTAFTAIPIRIFKKIGFSTFIWDPISYILERVYSDKFPKIVLTLFLKIAELIDKIIIKYSDNILTGGDAHNDIFWKLNLKKNIIEIPPSITAIKEVVKKKGDYVFMITAWKKGKNPEYVFEIIKNIPNIRIKMAGKWIENDYRMEFLRLRDKLGFQKNLEVLGSVNEKELSAYYRNALVLLQTNDDRGFGLPAFEAAANGTTFIIPEGQGVCKIFKNKVDGFFTEEKNTKQIVGYLNQLLADENLAIEMGKNAWKKVENNFNWEIHAKKIIKIIKN